MTRATGWRSRLAGAVAVTVAALAPVVAYVGNLGFAPLIALAGLASTAVLVGRRTPWPAFGLVFVAALLAAASYGWGVVRPTDFPRYAEVEQLTGLKLLLQAALYGAFVAAARELSPAMGRRALLILGVGFALVAMLLLVEALGGAALYQWIKREAQQATRPDLAKRNVARATYAAVLVLWPAFLALRQRGWQAVGVIAGAGTLAAAILFRVDAPLAALALSTVVFGLVRYGGAAAAKTLGIAAALFVAAAPLAGVFAARAGLHLQTQGVAKASWEARVQIWGVAATHAAERPLLGWGLDGSRAFPGVIPLHPHDMSLQVWLELGAAGAILAVAFWMLVFERCAAMAREDRTLAAAATASAAAYLVIGALSFGAWQEWWLALGALSAAAIGWLRRARRALPSPSNALYRAAP